MSSSFTSTLQETAISIFYVSVIEVKLARESDKTIESIRLYKNNQLPRDVEKTIRGGEGHREEFNPPLSVSLQDSISATVGYSTKRRKRVELPINIRLDDNGIMRENKEKGERMYRKKTKNIEVVVTVHQQSPPLIAVTTQIIQACSRFRILIIGDTGVGKSTLIHKVFGVDSVHASKNVRGEARIEQEFVSPINERLVVHDSLGFEAGDIGNMDIVKEFVAERKKRPKLTEQLHAIWLCLEIPYAGGRLIQAGVEEFLRRRNEILGDIPLVVVLTKVDLLDVQLEIDLPEGGTLGDLKLEYMNNYCIAPLHEAAGNEVTHATVSTLEGYSKSLSDLLKATEKKMVDYNVGEVPRVMAAIAQRISIEEKVQWSISIGGREYWNTLLTSAFHGRTLDECLKVIRTDITEIWNFNDPDKCLMNDRITNYLLRTDNLEGASGAVALPNGASAPGLLRRIMDSNDPTLSFLPTVLKFAIPPLFVHEKFQQAKKHVKILMAYIIDLVCLMQIVFLLASGNPVTDEIIISAVQMYEDSRGAVHRDVEAFDASLGGRNSVLEQTEGLIWHFSVGDDQIPDVRQKLSSHPGLVPSSSGSS